MTMNQLEWASESYHFKSKEGDKFIQKYSKTRSKVTQTMINKHIHYRLQSQTLIIICLMTYTRKVMTATDLVNASFNDTRIFIYDNIVYLQ